MGEPHNLLGVHCRRYSGLCNEEALDLLPKNNGKKDVVILRKLSMKHRRRPQKKMFTYRVNQDADKGQARIFSLTAGMDYRANFLHIAQKRFLKIKKTYEL